MCLKDVFYLPLNRTHKNEVRFSFPRYPISTALNFNLDARLDVFSSRKRNITITFFPARLYSKFTPKSQNFLPKSFMLKSTWKNPGFIRISRFFQLSRLLEISRKNAIFLFILKIFFVLISIWNNSSFASVRLVFLTRHKHNIDS